MYDSIMLVSTDMLECKGFGGGGQSWGTSTLFFPMRPAKLPA
jgi:hypothetical protein